MVDTRRFPPDQPDLRMLGHTEEDTLDRSGLPRVPRTVEVPEQLATVLAQLVDALAELRASNRRTLHVYQRPADRVTITRYIFGSASGPVQIMDTLPQGIAGRITIRPDQLNSAPAYLTADNQSNLSTSFELNTSEPYVQLACRGPLWVWCPGAGPLTVYAILETYEVEGGFN